MKRNWKNKAYLFLFIAMELLMGCNRGDKHTAHEGDQYTCSMHPQIVQDKPGTCPICGMELVRKTRPGQGVKITKELSSLLKPANSVVTTSIKTISPVLKVMEVKIEAKGTITHDTRKLATLSARYGGRIEKLFVKYNLQSIYKGEKILEIYSPEMITAQRDLLYLLEKDAGNVLLIESSKQKLRFLGLTEDQINRLVSLKEESYSFAVYSPVDGYIMEHSASDSNTPDRSPNPDQPMDQSFGLKIREGLYVTTGETLFNVVSHSDLWAEFDLHQQDVPYIKLNDPVTVKVDNSSKESMESTVNFIQPFIKDGQNLTKVRMYLSNPHYHYHAGQLVTATFTSSENAMWIPSTAKLQLGTKEVAFIKKSGTYRPKVILTGRPSGTWIEVVTGLEAGDSIAYNAQFMVDSESFIKVNQSN